MALHLFEEKKAEDLNLPEKVLESAHARAEKIIERALKKSEDIIQDMDAFRDQMKKELRPIFKQSADRFMQTISEESKEFADACDALVPQIKETYMKEVNSTLQGFKVELTKELVPVREVIEKQVHESLTDLKTHINEEWERARTEIESYKEERKKQLEKHVEEQIGILAREAFGNSLSVSEHQQLVMNALEKAKQEGVFNL